MLHHEESPEKPQYNMATPPVLENHPPFCLNYSFLAKFFTPPFNVTSTFSKLTEKAQSILKKSK